MGQQLGYRQRGRGDLQFWFAGMHFSGARAERLSESIEEIYHEGNQEILFGTGPFGDHTPYSDMNMDMPLSVSGLHNTEKVCRFPMLLVRFHC